MADTIITETIKMPEFSRENNPTGEEFLIALSNNIEVRILLDDLITMFNLKAAAPIPIHITDEDAGLSDGIYTPIEEGMYVNLNPVLEYDKSEGLTFFIKSDGEWFKNVTPINFTPTGVVEEDNPNAVSGGEVYNKVVNATDLDIQIQSNNILNPKYIVTGTTVQSSGNLTPNALAVSVIGHPVSSFGTVFTASGYVGNASRYYSFMDDNDSVIAVGNTSGSSKTLTVPSGATKFNMLLGSTSEDTSKAMFNTGSGVLPYDDFSSYIDSIKGNNVLPEGILNKEDIQTLDLTTLEGVNLFDKDSMVVYDRGLNSSGESIVAEGAGHTTFIKVPESTTLFIRKQEGAPLSGTFYSEPSETASYKASFVLPEGETGFINTTPATEYIRFNVFNTSNTDVQDRIDSLMVAVSSSEIDYIPFKAYLKAIDDVEVYYKEEKKTYSFPTNITNVMGNFKDKQQEIKDDNPQLIQIGFFGDSWTDRVPGAIYYVQHICDLLRDKLGYGGAGWYDFARSQGNTSAQIMSCADNRDISQVRTGAQNYFDGTDTSEAKGINMAHGEFGLGFKITLTLNELQEKGNIHFLGGSEYGSFSYTIGTNTPVIIDCSTTTGYTTTGDLPLDENTAIEIEVLSGTCIIFGINFTNNAGVVIHKFGNRSTGVYQYQSIDIDLWKAALSHFNLDSATLMLGGLDWTHNHTPSQYRQSLDFWLNQFKQVHPYADFAFVSQSELKLTGRLYTMEEFAEQMYQCAVDNSPEVGFMSLVPLFGSRDKIINRNLFYDDTHPTITMGKVIANEIVKNFFY